MTFIHENPNWEEAIYEIRTVDPVLGGTDGISNRQAAQLANRTQWLKEELTAHAEAADPHPQYTQGTEDLQAQTLGLIDELHSRIASLTDELAQMRNHAGSMEKSLCAPGGTRMVFSQTHAPAGWTKAVQHNDKALRVVSGEVSFGGVHGFSACFASRALSGSTDNTTLAEAQMPSHTHGVPHTSKSGYGASYSYGWGNDALNHYVWNTHAGGNGAHNHALALDQLDMRVAYVDVIIAEKDFG